MYFPSSDNSVNFSFWNTRPLRERMKGFNGGICGMPIWMRKTVTTYVAGYIWQAYKLCGNKAFGNHFLIRRQANVMPAERSSIIKVAPGPISNDWVYRVEKYYLRCSKWKLRFQITKSILAFNIVQDTQEKLNLFVISE